MMITDYVDDASHWELWKQAYVYGVLLIIPPDPLRSQINALRAKYPQSSTCDAHISLTVPLGRGMTRSDWCELEALVAEVEPFEIRYGPLMNYLPAAPGVCLTIEPQSTLSDLRVTLESASCFEDAPPRGHPFSAHMTLAEMVGVEETLSLMKTLEDVAPAGTFTCESVSYVVPDAAFRFTERARLSLKRDEKIVGAQF